MGIVLLVRVLGSPRRQDRWAMIWAELSRLVDGTLCITRENERYVTHSRHFAQETAEVE